MRDVEGKSRVHHRRRQRSRARDGEGVRRGRNASGDRRRARQTTSRTAKAELDVHAIQLDVTDRDAFARAADETERVLGNVHVLCNNAGINLFNDIADATYQDWDWVLGVNLGGVVNGVATFVPRIKAHGRGRARREHGVDGRVRRRPGRGHLHDGEVRGARAVGRAAVEPAAARDRRLDGLPRPREEQDLRERPDPAGGALDEM